MGARVGIALAAALVVLGAVRVGAETFPNFGTMGAATCFPVTGSLSPLYMAAGTCVDAAEASIEQPLRAPGILTSLACMASATFTGSITITGRTGACGTLADTPLTCTMVGSGSGRPRCNGGALKLTVAAADNCWSLKLTFAGPLSTPTQVSCSLVRAQ